MTLGEITEGSDPKRAVTAYENAVTIVTRYNTAAKDPVEKEFLDVNVRDVGSRIRRLRGEEEHEG